MNSPCDKSDYYRLIEDMCQSNRMPSSLQRLLERLHHTDIRSPAEYLIALVYYSFFESGFAPSNVPVEQKSTVRVHWGHSFVAQIPDISCATAVDEITQQFLRLQQNATEQVYEFKLNLLNLSDDELQLIVRKIFGGDTLCVTLCLRKQVQASSIILPVNMYISILPTEFNLIAQNPKDYFKNMDVLCALIKHSLIAPLRNQIMYESAYPNAALHGMTKETLWKIFGYLRSDLKSLQEVSKTCIYLRNMAVGFLEESHIRLKQRQPTPIIYDPLDQIHLQSPYRLEIGRIFFGSYRPLNYVFYR